MNEDEPCRAFLAAFQLDRFGCGRHILRDHRGWRIRDIQVRCLWLASIRPSFDPPASLFVVHTAGETRGLFSFVEADGLPAIHSDPVPVCDSVSDALSGLDLSPTNPDHAGLSLDGISYSLHVRAMSLSFDLHFSNPCSEDLCGIERSMLATARSLSSQTDYESIAAYLSTWQRYLSRSLLH